MSFQAFPGYMVGINISGALVTGCTITNSGVVTQGETGSNLASTGVVDDFQITRTKTLAQIQPINASLDNFVPLASGYTATATEIRAADGSAALSDIAGSFDYVEVQFFVTPPGAAGPTWTDALIGVIESTETAYVAEKNTVVMTIRPIGYATYAGAYSNTGA